MSQTAVDRLVLDVGQLATPLGATGLRREVMGHVHLVSGGSVAIKDGKIVFVGSKTEALARFCALHVDDLQGRGVLTPGLVDPHTHAVFGGNRTADFGKRIGGATYRQIAEAGGGILHTVASTRALTMEELADLARPRLAAMRATGTTTVEIKSGYALETGAELRTLGAIDILAMEEPMEVIATFMGAHEVPPEYRGRKSRYIEILIEEMIPAVAEQGIARFCDVFCEDHVFSVAESRRILEAARANGLIPKVHADELEPLGGAELAVEMGAISADHLGCVSDSGIHALAASETVAVLLPGTTFFLDLPVRAPARRLIEAGAIVALATDCNPGSSTASSMPILMSLGCIQLKLQPAEALTAATLNAAAALGLSAQKGTIEVGKDADLALWDAADFAELPYRFGADLLWTLWRRGEVVCDRRPRKNQP